MAIFWKTIKNDIWEFKKKEEYPLVIAAINVLKFASETKENPISHLKTSTKRWNLNHIISIKIFYLCFSFNLLNRVFDSWNYRWEFLEQFDSHLWSKLNRQLQMRFSWDGINSTKEKKIHFLSAHFSIPSPPLLPRRFFVKDEQITHPQYAQCKAIQTCMPFVRQ